MIYYLANLEDDTVKIGYTTPSKMKARFSNLKSSNSAQLRLVGTQSGTRDKETFIHTQLASYKTRKRGEWFHLDPIVIEYIEEHNDFEYFFDVFENEIKLGKLNQPLFRRMLEAFAYERGASKKLHIKANQYSDCYKNLSEWTNYAMMNADIEDVASQDIYYIFEEVPVYIWPAAKSTCP